MARRTTITLEDDVMDRLLDEARRSRRSFKSVVNTAIRQGLDSRQARGTPFRVEPRDLGLLPGRSLDSVSSLLEAAEGPEHR